VRGVAPGTLWLGAELAAHVPGARALAAEPFAEGVRITVAEDELDRVEAALAPVLPGPDDWRAGMDRLYGRV
jgi:hypothetical protein